MSENRARRALVLIYYAGSARFDEKAHAAYQRRLREEMAEASRI